MVAAMSTISGPAPGMAGIARIAHGTMHGWLGDYEGYRGLVVLTDEGAERARVITFWDSAESGARARRSRGAMREDVAGAVGLTVEKLEICEVPAWDIVPDGDGT